MDDGIAGDIVTEGKEKEDDHVRDVVHGHQALTLPALPALEAPRARSEVQRKRPRTNH